jgi:hypothetical protein
MAKKRLGFEIVGVTPDGKEVVSGVFRVFDTMGLPLDTVFDLCEQHKLVPSWIHFYDDAIKQGWSEKTIMNRLETSICDAYGKDYWLGVEERLTLYIKSLN